MIRDLGIFKRYDYLRNISSALSSQLSRMAAQLFMEILYLTAFD